MKKRLLSVLLACSMVVYQPVSAVGAEHGKMAECAEMDLNQDSDAGFLWSKEYSPEELGMKKVTSEERATWERDFVWKAEKMDSKWKKKLLSPAKKKTAKKYTAEESESTTEKYEKIPYEQLTKEQKINLIGSRMAEEFNAGNVRFQSADGQRLPKLKMKIGSYAVWELSGEVDDRIYDIYMNERGALMEYLSQAISRYPELCYCMTYLKHDWRIRTKSVTFALASPVKDEAEAKKYVERYRTWIENISTVPMREYKAGRMQMIDVMLYCHNEVIANCEYSTHFRQGEESILSDHCAMGCSVAYEKPYGSGRLNFGVCQSYAAIYNQLLYHIFVIHGKEIGWSGEPVCWTLASDTHAWNAVKLNGAYYYVDTTGDDMKIDANGISTGEQYCEYRYFLMKKATAYSDPVYQLLQSTRYMFPQITEENYGDAYSELIIRDYGMMGTRLYWYSLYHLWLYINPEGKNSYFGWSFRKPKTLFHFLNETLNELQNYQNVKLVIPNGNLEDYPGVRSPKAYKDMTGYGGELMLFTCSGGIFSMNPENGMLYRYNKLNANIAYSYAKQGNLLISTTGKTGTFRYCSLDMSEDAWTCVSTEAYGDYSNLLKPIS